MDQGIQRAFFSRLKERAYTIKDHLIVRFQSNSKLHGIFETPFFSEEDYVFEMRLDTCLVGNNLGDEILRLSDCISNSNSPTVKFRRQVHSQ